MFLINFIRFILGYITFTAGGGFPERFINMCALNGVTLWDIKNKSGVLHCKTNINGYKRIRKCAHKSGMKVRIYKKHGLPFFLNKYRYRVGFAVGFVIFFIIIALMSTRIWTIEVQGNKEVSDAAILSAFEELGVKVGTRASKINIREVQDKAYKKLPELSWLAINIDGSDAIIEVRESIKAPEILDTKTPCNVISNYDGQIIKLEVLAGKANVKIGDAVTKGDLLISGVVENKDLSSSLKHARGLVVAKTQREITAEQSLKTQRLVCIDEKSRVRFIFFGINIPLWYLGSSDDKNSISYSHKYQLKVSGKIIPIGYIKQGYKIYDIKKVSLTDSQRNLVAFEDFTEKMRSTLKDAKILESGVNIKKTGDICKIKGSYTCEEEIGKEQEIFVEN